MLEFRPFHINHLVYLTPQEEQKAARAAMLTTEYAELIGNSFALSAWDGTTCVGAAGCVPIFKHRAVAWALLSSEAAPHMLAISKKVRRVMAALEYKRIEISVHSTFEAGNRFARLIGMRLETPEPLKAHGANGEDEYMYAMVK